MIKITINTIFFKIIEKFNAVPFLRYLRNGTAVFAFLLLICLSFFNYVGTHTNERTIFLFFVVFFVELVIYLLLNLRIDQITSSTKIIYFHNLCYKPISLSPGLENNLIVDSIFSMNSIHFIIKEIDPTNIHKFELFAVNFRIYFPLAEYRYKGHRLEDSWFKAFIKANYKWDDDEINAIKKLGLETTDFFIDNFGKSVKKKYIRVFDGSVIC
uniref:Uncharacterized protein n=1 Tax=Phalansterium sp. PJK-2012 TaxID=1267188 RepID=T1QE28_9EUKA|nr:hypothetical protein [Phalansterium sp. PJK-2012]